MIGTALLLSMAVAPQGPTPLPPPPCDAAVEAAVHRAAAGDLAGAGRMLEAARIQCPGHPGVLRELAAVRFREGLHEASEAAVRGYLAREPRSAFGWDLLATLRYLADDGDGALRAWNRIDRPRVGGVSEGGTRAFEPWTLEPGALLTPGELRRARRRAEALPHVSRARVGWRPATGGEARVEYATTHHRPHNFAVGDLPAHVARGAGGAFELGATNRAGAGERAVLSGRFDRRHREVEARLSLPVPGGRGAAMRLEAHHSVMRVERFRVERSGARVAYVPWPGSHLRSEGWAGVDSWPGRGTYGALGARLRMDMRSGLGMELSGARWSGGFGTAELALGLVLPAPDGDAWRPEPGVSLRARAGLVEVSGGAPADLRPRFGARTGSTHLLRATSHHVPSGRRWLHGGLEAVRGWSTRWGMVVGGAAFVDAVRGVGVVPDDGVVPDAPRGAVHPGVGLRVGVPGVEGWFRADWAVDPRDGNQRISVGWLRPPG